jgi:uncharacterized membrane protein YedE/YeeE
METESAVPQGGGSGGQRTAAENRDPVRKDRRMLPVWFFVGIQLLIFGILITISGIVEFAHPPHTVLANLHAPIWWGALLIVIGAVYVHRFWPRKH